MAIHNIKIRKKNGSVWDELYPLTKAENVSFEDGENLQEKLNNGSLGGKAETPDWNQNNEIPDWNQNDETAADYIKNRTHYTEISDKIVVADTIIYNPEDTFSLTEPLEVGQTYNVTFKGETYECVAREYEGYIMIGNNAIYGYDNGDETDTGEPFAIDCEVQGGGTGELSEGEVAAASYSNFRAWWYFRDPVDAVNANILITRSGEIKLFDGDVDLSDPTYITMFLTRPLELDKRYIVTLSDGTSCECVAKSLYDTMVVVGNISLIDEGEDTGEPFIIGHNQVGGGNNPEPMSLDDGIATVATVATEGTIEAYMTYSGGATELSVNIIGINEIVHKLDKKFLPDEIYRIADNAVVNLYNSGNKIVYELKNGDSNYITAGGVSAGTGTNSEIFNDLTNNKASGSYTHAEGRTTTASAEASHAEGYQTIASGKSSHAEGRLAVASGEASHAEGYRPHAMGMASHAEGWGGTKIPSSITASTSKSDIQTAWTNDTFKFNLAKGDYSHTEGYNTLALENQAHAEGDRTIASGSSSHSEGITTIASGNYSHAEGRSTKASSTNSHAEGEETKASGVNSHAEGQYSTASGESSHAEGIATEASGRITHAEGYYSKAIGSYTHAEGNGTIASGNAAHSEGNFSIASGSAAHSEGINTIASGKYSHAEGECTIASGMNSHTEGCNTVATKGIVFTVTDKDNTNKILTLKESVTGVPFDGSKHEISLDDVLDIIIKGRTPITDVPVVGISDSKIYVQTYENLAYATHVICKKYEDTTSASHAEGSGTIAAGYFSHAEGYCTMASGKASHAEGYNTIASVHASHVMGRANKILEGDAESYSGTADAFVIGNSANLTDLSNAFRVTFDGSTYGLSAFNSTGADYAEYFEWADGNEDNEDRVGYFVTLEEDKIRKANSNDNYILGVISVNPSVVGDSHQDSWNNQYLTDQWGRKQYHYVDVPEVTEKRKVLTDEGIIEEQDVVIQEARQDYVPIYNPEWNSNEKYIPRKNRKEWDAVGIVGKLLIRDDGSCKVNGYCKPNDEGIAIDSNSGYRVIKRINDNIIQVFIK